MGLGNTGRDDDGHAQFISLRWARQELNATKNNITTRNEFEVQPYLTGEVMPLIDNFSSKMSEINSKVLELKDALFTLNSLEIKLKAPQEALLLTQSTNSLLWAEKNLNLDSAKNFIPLMAERLSFVGLQPVSGNTQSEVQTLQSAKLKAMDTKDTLERLDISMELVRKNISMVAAKLAIQSLEVP